MTVFHRCIERCETPFIIGSGTNLCDWVYISNVADAHVLAVRNLLNSGTAAGEAFFVTNGSPTTGRDFCLAVWKEFGHVPKFEVRIPKGLAWWLALTSEWVCWATGAQGTLSRGLVLDVSNACGKKSIFDGNDATRFDHVVPRRELPSHGSHRELR
jgi:sterol-4alpha-carboxylate 3-dehydrogenase (decarboxylating)